MLRFQKHALLKTARPKQPSDRNVPALQMRFAQGCKPFENSSQPIDHTEQKRLLYQSLRHFWSHFERLEKIESLSLHGF